MKIEWDFKELERFANKLIDDHTWNTTLMTICREVSRVLHNYLLIQTPIDTGNLRKMWSAGENLKFNVEPVNNGYQVTFINTAENPEGFRYGLAVNDGHRTPQGGGWVMGRFFVEKAILQTANSTQIEQIIMRELQKWWEKL